MSTHASTMTYDSWDKSSTKLEWHGILPKNMGRWNREEMIDLEGVTQDMIDSLEAVNWEDPNMADQFVHDEVVRMDATETNRGSRAALAFKKNRSDGTISCLYVKVNVKFQLSKPHCLIERVTPQSSICQIAGAICNCSRTRCCQDDLKIPCFLAVCVLILVVGAAVTPIFLIKDEPKWVPLTSGITGVFVAIVTVGAFLAAVIYRCIAACRACRRNNYKNMEEGEADTGQKNVNQDVMGLIEEVFRENGFQT